jgi:hypothetical protein
VVTEVSRRCRQLVDPAPGPAVPTPRTRVPAARPLLYVYQEQDLDKRDKFRKKVTHRPRREVGGLTWFRYDRGSGPSAFRTKTHEGMLSGIRPSRLNLNEVSPSVWISPVGVK